MGLALAGVLACAGPVHASAPAGSPCKVPLVLMHGMSGFEQIGSVGYFYGVRDDLTAQGYLVFATEVDPFNSVARRAEQAALQIDRILADTGAPAVHLIAHSQGGLDARYLVSRLGYGDRVLTLTTLSTPHHGTQLADAALGYLPDLAANPGPVLQFLDRLSSRATSTEVNLDAQLADLSSRGAEIDFNPATPDDPRVRYYSYAGYTQASPFVDHARVDLVNPALLASYLALDSLAGPNDGLVTIKSAQWGTFLGVLPADHWDEIGQPLGVTGRAFDHLQFYRGLAQFLAGRTPPPTYPYADQILSRLP